MAFESLDYHVCQALVASGVGVAFLPEVALRTKHPHVEARRVRGVARAADLPSSRNDGLRLPTIRSMVEVLKEFSPDSR